MAPYPNLGKPSGAAFLWGGAPFFWFPESTRTPTAGCLACGVPSPSAINEFRVLATQLQDSRKGEAMSLRVLVVEDEHIIGLDIAQQLANAGFEVLGPATSVATGLRFVAEPGCDVAVLNVNLGDETSEPIAQELRARGQRFVVVSGYSADTLPASFNGATVLTKPLSMADLLAAVRRCVDV